MFFSQHTKVVVVAVVGAEVVVMMVVVMVVTGRASKIFLSISPLLPKSLFFIDFNSFVIFINHICSNWSMCHTMCVCLCVHVCMCV